MALADELHRVVRNLLMHLQYIRGRYNCTGITGNQSTVLQSVLLSGINKYRLFRVTKNMCLIELINTTINSMNCIILPYFTYS